MGVSALLATRVSPEVDDRRTTDRREMERKSRKIAYVIISIILALVFVLVFLAFVGLGAAAAVIGSSCVDIDNCSQDEEETRRTSYYYMIGPTAAAFILPLLATILSYFIVELLIMFGKDEVEKKNQDTNSETDGVELVQLPADVVTRGESKKKKILAEFHTYAITEVHQADFNNLKCGALSMLFLAVLFFMLALLGVLWMIVVAFNFSQSTQLWPFIVTELIVGLVCPIFIFIGCALLAIVIAFVTAEQVDLRIAIQHLLPSVMLVQGVTRDDDPESFKFWVIASHFFIKLKKPYGEVGQLRHAVGTNLSTWLLVSIAGLAVILTVSYFVNQSFVQALTVPIQEFLEESDICLNYVCFNETNFDHIDVNCSNVTAVDFMYTNFLHCFRFLQFGANPDIITNVGISVGFYLATVHFFQIIFFVTTILMCVKQTRIWGILMIIVGVGIFVGAMVVLFSPHFTQVRLDVIKVAQFFLLAFYCVFIGILLCTGSIREIVPAPVKKTAAVAVRSKSGSEKQASLEASVTAPSGATHV